MPVQQSPTAVSLVVRESNGQPFYEAKFRDGDRQVKRRIGPAWLTRESESDGWVPRRGRVRADCFDERRAYARASEIVAAYEAQRAEERERRAQGATFREVAHAYLDWLEHVKGAAPSTLRQHRSDLAEPGVPYKRGDKVLAGHIMRAFGDKPAAKVSAEDVDRLLQTVADTGVAPRTVNRYREVVVAAFNFGMKSSKFKLASNPATDSRPSPPTRSRRVALLHARGGRGDRPGPRGRPAPRTARAARQLLRQPRRGPL